MTQEEKQLLLKDLCARLPYQPNVNFGDYGDGVLRAIIWKGLFVYVCDWICGHDYECRLSEVKPYLRPMSSMTEDEEDELNSARMGNYGEDVDWLNAHYFDYHIVPSTGKTLIESGLALEAKEGMYKIKET